MKNAITVLKYCIIRGSKDVEPEIAEPSISPNIAILTCHMGGVINFN